MTVTQKDTLVFGASLKSESYSNLALKKLRSSGIETKAFGLTNGTVYGVEIDISLKLYKNIHTVTLYLNPKHQKAYYDYLIQLKPQRVIFNPGTENPIFYKRLKEAGISYEIDCTLVLLSTNQY